MQAIIPAAGLSRRMGRSKPLLPFRGGTLIGAVIDVLKTAGVPSILVVIRQDDARLADWLAAREIPRAINPRPERGMLSSLWTGVEALGGVSELAARVSGLLVTPADHPSFSADTVERLLDVMSAGAGLAVPLFEDRRGHPLMIAPRLIAETLELDLDQGLRQLAQRHPEELVEVPVADPGVVGDIDTPEEYRRALDDRL